MTPYQEKQAMLDLIRRKVLKDKDLGRLRDRIVGERYGVNAGFVQRIRDKHDICCSDYRLTPEQRESILADPEIGIISDEKLGKRYGATKGATLGLRKREGIPHQYSNAMNRERALSKPNWRNELMKTWKKWWPPTISENLARANVADWSKPPFSATRYVSITEAERVAVEAGEILYRDDWNSK